MPRSRVTLRDVAALAGVSHQTVSRVINATERVNPDTRSRVEQAIQQLGYRRNEVARSMARGRTHLLACFSPNLIDFTFASMIEGAEQYARQQGYFLLSASAPDEETFACLMEELIHSRRADGLIVFNPFSDGRHRLAQGAGPLVFTGVHSASDDVDSISLDDWQAGYAAAEHLLGLGHRRMVCLTGPLLEDCSRERLDGFHAALAEAGVTCDPHCTLEGDWTVQAGFILARSLLETGCSFSALCAQNDRMAIGAVHALRRAGFSVPHDVSVIGVDDIPLAAYLEPPLTTLRQDPFAIGQMAAHLLIDRVEGLDGPVQHLLVPTELVVRESTVPHVPRESTAGFLTTDSRPPRASSLRDA
jgi:DNA-binding LacI/PurR family transcriptional regulator